MKFLPLVLASSLAFSFSSFAQPVEYEMDPTHTNITAQWNHLGFSNPFAHFQDISGVLVFDEKSPQNSKVSVSIPLSGLNSFVPALDEHLLGGEYFDAKTYPTINFESTKVEFTSDKSLLVYGDLTIKEITKPVVLDATLNHLAIHPMANIPAIGFDATTTISRSDFGMNALVPAVSDEIKISITTEAVAR